MASQCRPYSAVGHFPRPALTSAINGLRADGDLHMRAERRKPLAPGEALLTPVWHTASFQTCPRNGGSPPTLTHGGGGGVARLSLRHSCCFVRCGLSPCNAASLQPRCGGCGVSELAGPLCPLASCYVMGAPPNPPFSPTLEKNKRAVWRYPVFQHIPEPCLFLNTSPGSRWGLRVAAVLKHSLKYS